MNVGHENPSHSDQTTRDSWNVPFHSCHGHHLSSTGHIVKTCQNSVCISQITIRTRTLLGFFCCAWSCQKCRYPQQGNNVTLSPTILIHSEPVSFSRKTCVANWVVSMCVSRFYVCIHTWPRVLTPCLITLVFGIFPADRSTRIIVAQLPHRGTENLETQWGCTPDLPTCAVANLAELQWGFRPLRFQHCASRKILGTQRERNTNMSDDDFRVRYHAKWKCQQTCQTYMSRGARIPVRKKGQNTCQISIPLWNHHIPWVPQPYRYKMAAPRSRQV